MAVAERTGRSIVRVEWRDGDEPRLGGAVLPAVGGVADAEGLLLMCTSPMSAIAVSDTRSPQELKDTLSDGNAATVDVSHGFLAMQLAGTRVRALLDGLAPLDLSEKQFRPATLKRTQIANHSVTIHCTAADTFELYVDRSYAWSLWRFLSRSLDEAGD